MFAAARWRSGAAAIRTLRKAFDATRVVTVADRGAFLPLAGQSPSCFVARRQCGTDAHSSFGTGNERQFPPPEAIPLPEGVDSSKLGLFELVGTEGTGAAGDGFRAVLGVHGPREHWPYNGGSIDAARGGIFAIVEVAGKQYKVTDGDTLYAHRIPGEVSSVVEFDRVSIIGTLDWTVFGRPLIPSAVVKATVESQTRTAKVMVTKFKKRKGYLRRRGHRQLITRLHIDSIDYTLPSSEHIVPHVVAYDPMRPPMPNNMRFV
jgi:large subunit ribosomal protein L21